MQKARILLHDPVDARLTCLGFSHALRMKSIDVNLPDATRPSACVLAHALVINQGFQLTQIPGPQPALPPSSSSPSTFSCSHSLSQSPTSCSQLLSY